MKLKIRFEFEDGKILELSEEKAKELYYKLNELYGESIIWRDPWPIHPTIPYPPPVQPWYTGDPVPTHPWPVITCEVK